jgi:hypothetical protein
MLTCLALLLVALPAVALGQAMPLKPDLQALIFKKIFQYDLSVVNRQQRVLVLYSPVTRAIAEEMTASFDKLGVSSAMVTEARLIDALVAATAVYLRPDDVTPAILDACAKAHVLTLSSDLRLAEAGKVAIALGLVGGKPSIVIHRRRLAQEQHTLRSEVLKMARLVE